MPSLDDLRVKILEEAHKSRLSFHPGMTKMYQDLKRSFWWHGMKKDDLQRGCQEESWGRSNLV